MRTFDEPFAEDTVRDAVRSWVNLLAEDRYDEALALLYHDPTATDGDGAWTPDSFRQYIGNYGSYDPYPDGRTYRVTPLREEDRDEFERLLTVDAINSDATFGCDVRVYAGIVHVNLPLGLPGEPGSVSDLTAIFLLRRLGDGRLALELYDCHVM